MNACVRACMCEGMHDCVRAHKWEGTCEGTCGGT